MSRAFIPNSSPSITERELAAVERCLTSGRIGSISENLHGAETALRQFTGGNEVLLTTSCTLAMELALNCMDLQPGDEVIVPTYTFVSTANAVIQAGGTPVFVDSEDETANFDLNQVEAAVTGRTRGILPVHYNAISCDMDRLLAFAKAKGLFVVEDAAHGVGAKYKQRFLGTLGDFGCFSFHDTKNYICGEGGATVLNNPAYSEHAEWIHEKGTNRTSFLRGEIDKYTWVSKGSSYILSGILASLLEVQLQRFEEILLARRAVTARYRQGLQSLVDEGHIRFMQTPDYATPNEHLAFFLVNDPAKRTPLLQHLKLAGIGAVFHYIPLHLSPYAKQHFGTRDGQFPVAERIASSIVRLPLFPHLSPSDTDYIIDQVQAFYHPERPSALRTQDVSYGTRSAGLQETVDFTLVVPCYHEEGHLHQSLDEVIRILDRMSLTYEIILIDDSSTDRTPDLIKEYIALHPHHRIRALFHTANRGRGATVNEGIAEAKGRYVGFLDIDLEVSAKYLPTTLMKLLDGSTDFVLANRREQFTMRALSRYITTNGYQWLVRTMLGIPRLDTEAGFKFFRRDAIVPVIAKTDDPHWFWDTEVTVLAHDMGLRICSEPVLFVRKPEKKSTVKIFRDSWRSFKALLAFHAKRKAQQRDAASRTNQ